MVILWPIVEVLGELRDCWWRDKAETGTGRQLMGGGKRNFAKSDVTNTVTCLCDASYSQPFLSVAYEVARDRNGWSRA
jgi:hypothetical protein